MFAKAGNFKNGSLKTGTDLIWLRGSHEVFKDFQAELKPFAVESFYQLVACNKKEYVFQAKLLESVSHRFLHIRFQT